MDAIVDECIALIAPDAQHEAECRHWIENTIDVLCWFNTPEIEPPPKLLELLGKNEEDRREWSDTLMKTKLLPVLKTDHEALQRFAQGLVVAVRQLEETRCRHFLFLRLSSFDAAKVLEELKTLVVAAMDVANHIQLHGSMPVNIPKLTAATLAKTLIETHGSKRPTLTDGGPYYRLASILYSAATGEHEVDLSRQCRRALRGRNEAA
jgi:hypothetical protein